MTDVIATTGLLLKEGLIFERSSKGRIGFELPPLDVPIVSPTHFRRKRPAELPEVSELDVIRHFTRLSSWNYSIDLGTFPLGSCTMKYNPRINEEIAALSGFSEIHPALPQELCQGALEIIYRTEKALCDISGMDSCTTQPAAGAQGEFTGLKLIRKYHTQKGNPRKLVLIPDTAHGTNPASCTLVGYSSVPIPTQGQGVVSVAAVEQLIAKHGTDIAALMMTNPNTLGIFEANIFQISERLHGIGAQLYMDGANMNAILGQAKPRDMGVDVMQYNLHKTFSTPHGGGGPGSGPVAVREHLAPFLPNPRVRFEKGKYFFVDNPDSIGKVKQFYGNFGVLVRALTYIYSHGSDGLRQVSRTAVLNANYLKKRLSEYFQVASTHPSLHECVLTDARQVAGGVKTLQIAKALIDEGFHPPTVYFPLVVNGAMLIEPTETESLSDLDAFVSAMIRIAKKIESKEEQFEHAPTKTIVGKVDEVGAARNPILSLDDRHSG